MVQSFKVRLTVGAMTLSVIAAAACGGQLTSPFSARPSIGGQLAYIGFEGDDLKDPMQAFNQKNGIVVGATYVGSPDETLTKLKAGGLGKYDVGTTVPQNVQTLIDQGYIEPLDTSLLSHFKDLYPSITDPKVVPWAWRDGKLYALPAVFGFDVVNYNADKVGGTPKSWDEMLDPKWKGRVCMRDNPVGLMIGIASHLGLGIDGTKYTKDDVAKMAAWGKRLAANAKTFVKTYGEVTDLMVRGDCDWGWIGWEFISINSQKQRVNVKNFSEPGARPFADAFIVFKDAPNRATAYAWLDQLLSPEMQAAASQANGVQAANGKSCAVLPADFAATMECNTAGERFKSAQWQVNPPPNSTDPKVVTTQDLISGWEQVKAAKP